MSNNSANIGNVLQFIILLLYIYQLNCTGNLSPLHIMSNTQINLPCTDPTRLYVG